MRRYYAILFIGVLMFGSIPELRLTLEQKLIVARPILEDYGKLAYSNLGPAITPLIGKILGKATLVVNGKPVSVDTANDYSLTHGQSLTPDQIDKILEKSPAKNTGSMWVSIGQAHNIDAAYMVAIFSQESSFAQDGTGWAGFKPNGSHTYNIGNMICAGFHTCYGAFRDYSGIGVTERDHWYAGIEDNTKNLAYYRDKMGIKDFDKAIMTWAPPSENNTDGYIANMHTLLSGWRSTNRIINVGDMQAISAPILATQDSAFGWNVKAALDANNGALRNITIPDNTQWSFNETMGSIDESELKTIVHPGDGWCDLACRYIQVFKALGLHITHGTVLDSNDMVFLQHGGIALNSCSYDESPYIWSNGTKGFKNGLQDLIVNNRTGKTIVVTVIDNKDGTATVAGKLQ